MYTELYMELNKKTTILFSHKQFDLLKRIAAVRRTSIGELIRKACEHEYGLVHKSEAEEAVDALAELSLPAYDIEQMKAEIVDGKIKPEV